MNNRYLNLSIDNPQITHILLNIKSKFNINMSFDEFKNQIIELDNIDNSYLSEYDEDLISDIYNSLSKQCNKQVKHFLSDNTFLNRGETMGSFMKFIYSIN